MGFLSVYEGVASKEYCEAMIQELEKLLRHKSGWKDGDVFNPSIRKDVSRYFNIDSIGLADETHNILSGCVEDYISEHPSLGMLEFYSRCVKVKKVCPKGGFHAWHNERDTLPDGPSRVLVWMIYLNDIPEGEGETEFLELGRKIQPKQGDVVLFPADWTHTHRGNPVYSCDKYIATGWYNQV